MLDEFTTKKLRESVKLGIDGFDIIVGKEFSDQPVEDSIELVCNWFSTRSMTVVLEVIEDGIDAAKLKILKIIGGKLSNINQGS